MAIRTGKVILARGIRLDKEYKNILNYTEQQMVALVTSKAVATANNCSFLRQGANSFDMAVSYSNAIKCNYLAFQNPDYSNKWFFAFIDSVEYVSNGTTRINFTIDECSTWFDYWSAMPCLTIREHVNDDTVGLNIVDEGLEYGEYVTNSVQSPGQFDDLAYMIQATSHYADGRGQYVTNIGGVYNNGTMFYCPAVTDLAYVITNYDQAGKGDAIQNVYMIPRAFVANKPTNPITANDNWWHGSTTPASFGFTTAKQTTLNGYTPRNKKLLCYPYNILVMDNNNGSSNPLNYEDFYDQSGNCTFTISGVPTAGGSIKCVPTKYKGMESAQQEGLVAGKFPTCGWTNDVYTNWLTQNAVNLQQGHVAQVANLIGGGLMSTVGIATGNPMLAGAGGSTVGSAFKGAMDEYAQRYQHSIMPPTSGGNINCGDVITCGGDNRIYFLKMSIKSINARRIDEFFDRFGYKVNRLKTPNQTGRPHWNFVQIAAGEDIGESTNQQISVPAASMNVINSAYRAGTTVWHSHDEIGNFALDNTLS